MIKADYHMHTYFSSDSDTPPEAMENRQSKGADGFVSQITMTGIIRRIKKSVLYRFSSIFQQSETERLSGRISHSDKESDRIQTSVYYQGQIPIRLIL